MCVCVTILLTVCREYLQNYVERIPLETEMKAHKVIRVCEQRDLHDTGACVCVCVCVPTHPSPSCFPVKQPVLGEVCVCMSVCKNCACVYVWLRVRVCTHPPITFLSVLQ